MKPPSTQLRHQVTEELAAEQAHTTTTQSGTAREFATPEELLRHDRTHTPVPPAVSERLEQSLAAEKPAKPKPWWKRLGR
ncbi:MAG TPA: hypothetical protein VMB21_02355 [Candidatus Limnocylindria bacterium]|jgi:hypothetical protein|nr:hypothetical protein [Candidatus Limnocylindria bacterium]